MMAVRSGWQTGFCAILVRDEEDGMATKRMMMVAMGLGIWVGGTALATAAPLQQSIEHGKHLFTTAHFAGNGRTCETCHRGAGRKAGMLPNGKTIPSLRNAAAIFPRYNKRAGKVITLQQQVHSCILNALQGTPPAADGADMTDLVSYLTSLSQGKAIDMGGAPK
jgi:thiosulfate dehydrogenase